MKPRSTLRSLTLRAAPRCSPRCAVGPTTQRPDARRRRPPSRKAAAAGSPRRRPTRWTAGRGGSCSATRCWTSWRAGRGVEPERRRRRGRLRAGARAGRASSARRCSRSVGARRRRQPQRRRRRADGRAQQLPGRHRRAAGSPTCGAACARGVDSARGASAQASAADLAAARAVGAGRARRRTTSSCARPTPRSRCWQTPSRATSARCRSRRTATTPASSRSTDVLQAQTQLANAQADLAGLERQRAQLEHAIAVLVGKAPANFASPRPTWKASVPDVPLGVPSTLLQRRPDIAAAERARGGGQRADRHRARRPTSRASALSGIDRRSARRSSATCSAPRRCCGRSALSLAQTVFDAGATRARVDRRAAGLDAGRRAVPPDRADGVPGRRGPARRVARAASSSRRCASRPPQRPTRSSSRCSTATAPGRSSYTEVVTAQVTALNARRALVQAQADRQTRRWR